MQDPPAPVAILDLAIAQLSAGASGDAARDKFETRVAVAALELVKRSLELTQASDAAELERLSALLGEAGTLEALNRRVCAHIREGAFTLATPGLAAHLRATAMEKLAVDQPTYAAYRRALNSSQR